MTEERTAADMPLPGGDFRMFVTRLSFQAMISLGLLENPLTQKKQPNPDNARMVIADLRMLQTLTDGNLNADESAHLGKVVDDLTIALQKLSSVGS